ncbi:MAG: cytochrome c, partial [Rubripirellula sp.]|nr:cytochrome c [Rubripirellula sp.]
MRIAFLLAVVCLLVGCDSRFDTFQPNDVFSLALAKTRSTSTELASRDTSRVVEDLYGTPDEPLWPVSQAAKSPLSDECNLLRSSGPVSSEKDGTHLGLF